MGVGCGVCGTVQGGSEGGEESGGGGVWRRREKWKLEDTLGDRVYVSVGRYCLLR